MKPQIRKIDWDGYKCWALIRGEKANAMSEWSWAVGLLDHREPFLDTLKCCVTSADYKILSEAK